MTTRIGISSAVSLLVVPVARLTTSRVEFQINQRGCRRLLPHFVGQSEANRSSDEIQSNPLEPFNLRLAGSRCESFARCFAAESQKPNTRAEAEAEAETLTTEASMTVTTGER